MTKPPFSLQGRVAAITGAGSGIGRSIARRFSSRGARVAVLDVDGGAAKEVAGEIRAEGGQAEPFACDVADAGRVEETFAAIQQRFSGLQILVNNAGIACIGKIAETSEEDLDRLYAVNVKGVYLCTRAALPMLLQDGGVILNMASIASLIGVADRFAYSMSKGAVLTMTRSVAIDYLQDGIRCNCICPARVHTPFVDGYLKAHYPGREQEMFETLSRYQPIGRMAHPEEVADLALYLCSDEASYITGQAVPLDGGVLLV